MRSIEPDEAAQKEIMRCVRGTRKSRDNSFFISKTTGQLIRTSWRDDQSWFPPKSLPQNTYEIHVSNKIKNAFYSYNELREFLKQIMKGVWEKDDEY